MVAPLLAGLLLLWQAWLIARVVSLSITQPITTVQLRLDVFTIIIIICLRATIIWAGAMAASKATESIKHQLRQALFVRLLANGSAWTSRQITGELSAAVIDHTEALDGYFARWLPSAVAAIFLPLAFSLVLLPLNWVVALLLLISAPLIPIFMALVGWGAEAASSKYQNTVTRLSGLFADRVRGAFTLRLFGRTYSEINTVRNASLDLSTKVMAVLRIAFLSSAVLEFFAALGVASVAVYIGLGYLGMLGSVQNHISLQTGLFCLLMAPEVYVPLRQFAASYHDRAKARAAITQIHKVFIELPEPMVVPNDYSLVHNDLYSYKAINNNDPVLQITNLYSADNAHTQAILSNVSFSLFPDQAVALMGASGSGKTTLLETLCGLRRYSAGSVFYHGNPVDLEHGLNIKNGVVLISQKPFFAAASIASNLRIANRHASEYDLWRALDQACATDFVRKLPNGLATCLGTGGYGLSGGQLQRLALARLFLTNPALILLDEPTAHLDAHTRNTVINAICCFAKGKALLLATHDPEVAQQLGTIWFIENGMLVTQ